MSATTANPPTSDEPCRIQAFSRRLASSGQTHLAAGPHPLVRPLKLGSLSIASPVVQAALSGYSDGPMRRVARRLGAPYTICEVLLDQFVVTCGKRMLRQLQLAEEEHPVGGQLMGSEPEGFGPAARRLVEAGFDVIDINFGCPVKKVLGRCRGGYHLSQPQTALEIVSRVRDAVPERIPVTVKMRRGIDDSQESLHKFLTIFDGVFSLGVAAVTVHGRTVQQRYNGQSNWEFLRQLKQYAPDRTVLGSGDLFTGQACREMILRTGVDGVTAARGAIGYPWIFRDAQALLAGDPLPEPPTVREQGQVIAQHYGLADELYGPEKCVGPMRKFGIKYAQLHPDLVEVRNAFVQVRRPGQWQEIIQRFYSDDRPGRRPSGPDDSHDRSPEADCSCG